MVEEGFVWNPIGPYRDELVVIGSVKKAKDDLSIATVVGYAVVENGKVVKNGSSGKSYRRKELGYNPDDDIREMYNLDLLSEAMDTKLQKSYRDMIANVTASALCPRPLRSVMRMFADRGGEQLVTKGKYCQQLAECGANAYYHTRPTAEFMMFDKDKYASRVNCVQEAFFQAKSILLKIFGGRPAFTSMASSWAPGVSGTLADGKPRLCSTPIILESIMGYPLDMAEIDTIPYGPPVPYDETTYTAEDLAFGLERFDGFVEAIQPRNLQILDTNSFLFTDKHSGPIDRLLTQHYRVVMNIWDNTASILANGNKAIYLVRPLRLAADAREGISTTSIVQRGMSVQLLAMIVAWAQNDEHRAQMNASFHDGVFQGYVAEYAEKALHMPRRAVAAACRDVYTDPEVYALKQNDLPKTFSDDKDYPIAKNLKKIIKQGGKSADNANVEHDEPDEFEKEEGEADGKAFSVNTLVLRRVMNLISYGDLSSLDKVAILVAKCDVILSEDSPTYKTLRMRWELVLKKLKPDSCSQKALAEYLKSKKQNKGYKASRGKTKAEWGEYNRQIDQMKNIGVGGGCFWVYLADKFKQQGIDPPSSNENLRGFPVYEKLVLGGVKTNLLGTDLKIRKVYSRISRNGAFVLCELQWK